MSQAVLKDAPERITIKYLDQFTRSRGSTLWRAIAKDGWDLSVDQTAPRPAREDYLSVGETRDYYFTPEEPGELYLRAIAFPRMWVSATLIVSSPQK